MHDDERFDAELSAWLARQEPPVNADRVVEHLLADVSVTNQGMQAPLWRTLATVAAAAVLVGVAVASGILPTSRPADRLPTPSVTPPGDTRLPAGGSVITFPGTPVLGRNQFVHRSVGGDGAVWTQARLDRRKLIVRVDPATNQVTTEVPGLWNLAWADGQLWALQEPTECCAAATLVRVDPVTGAVMDRLPDAIGHDLAVADGTGWVLDVDAGVLRRVDLDAWRVSAVISVQAAGGGGYRLAGVGGGFVWVTSDGVLYRVDPGSNAVTATIPIEAETDPIGGAGTWTAPAAYAQGSLWLRVEWSRVLLRIDPATATVQNRYDVGAWQGGIAALNDELWVIIPGGLGRFDVESGELRDIQPLPWTFFYDLTAVGNELWIALAEQLRVVRFPVPEPAR